MINPTHSFHKTAVDPSRFHAGVFTPLRVDEAPEPPIEQIVASHTAIRPSRGLCIAYVIESILTGLPLLVVDLLLTGGGLIVASLLVNFSVATLGIESSAGLSILGLNPGVWRQLPALLLLQTVLMSIHQLYPGAGVSPVAELRGVVRSTVFSLVCLSAMNVLLGELPRSEFVTFALTAFCVSVSLPAGRWATRRLLAKTRWWGIRMLLIGQRDDCLATLRQLLRRRSAGFIPTGYVCESKDAREYGGVDKHLLGNNDEATAVARQHLTPVAGLVSSPTRSHRTDQLAFHFPSVVWIDFATAARNDVDLSNLPQVFTTRLDMPFLRFMPRLVKRCTDIAICVPTLIALCIPMMIIIGIIKLVSPGPAFFGHMRIGQHGSRFRAWKFRTMVQDADKVLQDHLDAHPEAELEWKRTQKLKQDPRVIGLVGGFFRKWSLDELPQLWNVLVGEMSLVGPRPIVYSEIGKYSQGYLAYSHMLPGITGLWQISGRNNTSYATRVQMDVHYARTWTPWLDFWVLLKTPAVVLTRDGAY